MIVDVHTVLPTYLDAVPESDQDVDTTMVSGSAGSSRMTNSMDDFLEAMAPVDRAVTLGIAPPPKRQEGPDFYRRQTLGWPDSMTLNDAISEVARRAPNNKIVPFMALHPLNPNVNEEYDRAVGDLGCRGLKLHPPGQRFDPESDEAFRALRPPGTGRSAGLIPHGYR